MTVNLEEASKTVYNALRFVADFPRIGINFADITPIF